MKRTIFIAAVVAILGLFLVSGCVEVVKVGADHHTHTPVEDPLVGTWKMTRSIISPQIPVPNLVLNQVIPEKATWQITRVNGVLKINYDGKDTWFNTQRINITRKPTVATENSSKRGCTFDSGGSIYLEKLPTVISMLLQSSGMEQFNTNFDDSVFVSIPVDYDACCGGVRVADDEISAIIEVKAQGKYYEQGELGGAKWKILDQSGTVTYKGTRKE